MKNKKLALLSLGLVAAVAGVATSSAFLYNEATASASGALDQGIILAWDDTNFTDITNFTPGMTEIRSLTLEQPTKSTSVTGYAILTLQLTTEDGVQVEIAKEEYGMDTPIVDTLTIEDNVYTEAIDLTTFNAAITYYLRFSVQTTLDDLGGESQNATLKASLVYSETDTTVGA